MLKTLKNQIQTKLRSNNEGLSHAQRAAIAKSTVNRSKDITTQHASDGATLSSTFIKGQLPKLSRPQSPNYPKASVDVYNLDSFTAARKHLFPLSPSAIGATAVLNLASDEQPAGGWLVSFSRTQEEALCYSSTLYCTLDPAYYPWPNTGPGSIAGVFSPGVVVFRDDLDHDLEELAVENRKLASVITVAAPRYPELTDDKQRFKKESDLEDLRGKIRLVYRMAARNGCRFMVLGAMGCGAYGCPPKLVAEEMKTILLDEEFKGWFRKVIFAVYSKDGGGNFKIFSKALKGVQV